jgi:hypothetical protein
MTGFKTITARYGVSKRSATVPENATVGDIINDKANQVVLGYGDKVQGIVHGVPQENWVVVADGATLEIEAKANEKAS